MKLCDVSETRVTLPLVTTLIVCVYLHVRQPFVHVLFGLPNMKLLLFAVEARCFVARECRMKLEQNSDGDAHKAVITATLAVYHTQRLTCFPLIPQDIYDREQWMTGSCRARAFSVRDTLQQNKLHGLSQRAN
jgi:hypothetical protein